MQNAKQRHRQETISEELPFPFEEGDGLGAAWGEVLKVALEVGVGEGLVAFLLHLGIERVTEEGVVAENVLGGLLVVGCTPTAIVVLEVDVGCIGEVLGGGIDVVVDIREVFIAEIVFGLIVVGTSGGVLLIGVFAVR